MGEPLAEQKRKRRANRSVALTASTRTFNPRDISRMSEDEAYRYFVSVRFKNNDGKAQCPQCGCGACYEYRARRIFKCMSCEKQFSATTKTIFARRKLSFRQILELIVEFALPAKGISAIQVSKNLGISYRTAFYRLQAFRGGMQRAQEGTVLDMPVEIDGAEFGGYIRPKNLKAERTDHRRFPYRSTKKQVVGVIRERGLGGRTRVVVGKTEHVAAKLMPKFIKPGTRIYADWGRAFNFLKDDYDMRRIKHLVEFWRPEVSTNNAECFFSVFRRAEQGIYHHVAGKHFEAYANEVAWRQDRRRTDTKTIFEDLCVLSMVPFERRSATVVQEEFEKGQTEELTWAMLRGLGRRRRAAIALRAKASTKSKIEDLDLEIRCLDKQIAAILATRHKPAWKLRNKK